MGLRVLWCKKYKRISSHISCVIQNQRKRPSNYNTVKAKCKGINPACHNQQRQTSCRSNKKLHATVLEPFRHWTHWATDSLLTVTLHQKSDICRHLMTEIRKSIDKWCPHLFRREIRHVSSCKDHILVVYCFRICPRINFPTCTRRSFVAKSDVKLPLKDLHLVVLMAFVLWRIY